MCICSDSSQGISPATGWMRAAATGVKREKGFGIKRAGQNCRGNIQMLAAKWNCIINVQCHSGHYAFCLEKYIDSYHRIG